MKACDGCDNRSKQGIELGIAPDDWDYIVALAGNPNTGKSTVFNGLTGLHQHTGNWPGKTVSRAEGRYEYRENQYKLIDLPGTYSLLSASQDEEIARNFILFGEPDCTVVVADATLLERNLNLLLQVLEISSRVILCLNCIDEAQRKGISIDIEKLQDELGIPVIPTAASNKQGLEELKGAIEGLVKGEVENSPQGLDEESEWSRAVSELIPMIEEEFPSLPNPRWIASRLIEGDLRIRKALSSGELGQLGKRQREAAESFSSKMALEGKQ